MKKKAVFLSIIFLVGTFVAGYVMFAAGKEIYRGRKIEQEIEKLRAEAEKIKADNNELREKITYLDTDQFRERIAKEKLNLKKDGEKVIKIKPAASIGEELESSESRDVQAVNPADEFRNYQKWWKQFFSY